MPTVMGSFGITGGDVIAYLHVRREASFCGRSNILGGGNVPEWRVMHIGKKHICNHVWSCHMTCSRAGFRIKNPVTGPQSLKSVCFETSVCVCVCVL